MKKIIFPGIIFMSFFIISPCFGADETVTTAGKPLTIKEFVGTENACLMPTMFPNFYKDVSENPTCADYLMDGEKGEVANEHNGEGKNRWTTTRIEGTYTPRKEGASCSLSSTLLKQNEYQPIPGLSGSVNLAQDYRNITKIFFTWTVRVEGYQVLVKVWPSICHPHHGNSYQRFPAGPLKTQLYVKGTKYASPFNDGFAPVGQIAEMTVPSAGIGMVSNPGDPTITGSYVLLPDDFVDGKLPEGGVEFQVRWYNETSMNIKSPAKQRNLIVTIFPVTN